AKPLRASACAAARPPMPPPAIRIGSARPFDISTPRASHAPREYSEPVSQLLQFRRKRVIPGLIRGPKGHFSKKTDHRGHERVKARATLLIGALIAPWRGGGVPPSGGRALGRSPGWGLSGTSSHVPRRR